MLAILHRLGLPKDMITATRRLHIDSVGLISLKGNSRNSFHIDDGMRQGCPISPLIFALVSDVFIRALRKALPHDTIRAYANDVALVAKDIRASFGMIAHLFLEHESVSGLALNTKKLLTFLSSMQIMIF